MTDYDRFKADHPDMLKLAEEHLAETERMAVEIDRLKADLNMMTTDRIDRQRDYAELQAKNERLTKQIHHIEDAVVIFKAENERLKVELSKRDECWSRRY